MISAGLCFMLHHICEKFWRSERDKISEMERDGQTTHSHTHTTPLRQPGITHVVKAGLYFAPR